MVVYTGINMYHKRFMKQCLGLRPSTSDNILLNELNRRPLNLSALKQTFTFRNKIMARPDNELVKIAMVESNTLATEGTRCWAFNLARYFPCVLLADPLPLSTMDSLSPIVVPDPIGTSYFSVIRDRSDSERIGTKSHVYNTWFSCDNSNISHTFWFNLYRPNQICTMARFRMGAHRLNVESERWRRPHVPRSQRICRCCNLGVVEDELHLMYCPLYTDVRFQYKIHLRGIGQIDHSMHALMNANDYDGWHALSNYLIACFKRRDDFLLRGLQLPSLIS
jgi:hypothetical protein